MRELIQRRDTLVTNIQQLQQEESGRQSIVAQLVHEIKRHRTSLKSTPAFHAASPLPPPPPPVRVVDGGERGADRAKEEGSSRVHSKDRGVSPGEEGALVGVVERSDERAGLTESWMVGGEGEAETEDSDTAMDILELEHIAPKVRGSDLRCIVAVK